MFLVCSTCLSGATFYLSTSYPVFPVFPCPLRLGTAGMAYIRSTEETQSNGNTRNSLPHTGNRPGTTLGTRGTFLARAFDNATRTGLPGAPGNVPSLEPQNRADPILIHLCPCACGLSNAFPQHFRLIEVLNVSSPATDQSPLPKGRLHNVSACWPSRAESSPAVSNHHTDPAQIGFSLPPTIGPGRGLGYRYRLDHRPSARTPPPCRPGVLEWLTLPANTH